MILTEKLHRIILLFVFLLISFVAFSQTSVLDKKISIQFSNKPLGQVLKSIEKRADVNFVYVSGLFDTNKHVNISVKNTSLRIVIRKLLHDKTIEFQNRGKNIVLSKKERTSDDKEIYTDKVSLPNKRQDIETLKPAEANPIIQVSPSSPFATPTPVLIKDTLAAIEPDTSKVNQIPEEKLDKENVKSIETVSTSVSNGKWHIGVYGGYSFLSEKLSQNNALYVLFKEVEGAETIKSVFNGGISLEYKKGNWGFQTGLGITSKKWSVEYNYKAIATDFSNIVGYDESTSWEVAGNGENPGNDNFGDSTRVITRTPIYEKDTTNVNYSNVNAASYLVVPLQLNHYYSLSKHFGLQLGFATQLMLLYSSQGMIKVSKNSELENIDKYLKDYYLRLKLMVGFNYFLTERNILSLQTGYGFNATSAFKAAYPIDRSETAISIDLSYAWRF